MNNKINKILELLNKNRREQFLDFGKITLDQDAVRVLSNLFENPDCLSLKKISEFKSKKTKLKDLSANILTAAPTTLAEYSKKNRILNLTKNDILKCFAIDHIKGVLENKVVDKKSPDYALAHVLTLGEILKIKKEVVNLEDKRLIDLKLFNGSIVFKNVFVPNNLFVQVGQKVWQHFGVVIDLADDSFFEKVYQQQLKDDFFQEINKFSNLVIDYKDVKYWQENLLEKILFKKQDLNKKIIKVESNLKKQGVIFSH